MLDIAKLLRLVTDRWPRLANEYGHPSPIHGHSIRLDASGEFVLTVETGNTSDGDVHIPLSPMEALAITEEDVVNELARMVEAQRGIDVLLQIAEKSPDGAAVLLGGRLVHPRPHPQSRGVALPESHMKALLAGGQVLVWIDPTPKVGDRLFVKETWQVTTGRETGDLGAVVRYRVDGMTKACQMPDEDPYPLGLSWSNRWRASTTMPKWASRMTVEVTDVSDRSIVGLALVGEAEEERILAKRDQEAQAAHAEQTNQSLAKVRIGEPLRFTSGPGSFDLDTEE